MRYIFYIFGYLIFFTITVGMIAGLGVFPVALFSDTDSAFPEWRNVDMNDPISILNIFISGSMDIPIIGHVPFTLTSLIGVIGIALAGISWKLQNSTLIAVGIVALVLLALYKTSTTFFRTIFSISPGLTYLGFLFGFGLIYVSFVFFLEKAIGEPSEDK